MPGFFPQGTVENLRTLHFLVAIVPIDATHILFDFLPDRPPLWMPEHHSRRFVLKMKQVELPTEPAMVPFLGLLEHVQVGLLIFLPGPGRPVDPLQLLVAMVTAPVGARQFHQLEHLQPARRRNVRAAAEVDKITLAIERDFLTGRNGIDQFRLVVFADRLEESDGVVALPDLALHRQITPGEFCHALLDCRQVVKRERTLVGEVVVETVFDDRTDRDLRRRKEFLDRVSHQVRHRVTDDLQALGILLGDDAKLHVSGDLE
ncbi:MAG: hypothetical protein AW09_000841 [Candidatus Accumulibacter phosphatis]|uniref:Uncharacterized protein n=1 Tax=Candidatus Accumulibacter phosphatis TaxID=327160 RepID=A0A080LY89_9PROT|nr:MAG: hypothetical protein AW09_000841 [Candidatus Accumulibacter phosphatis]